MSEISPNLLDLDRFAVEVKRIDKPWGYEIVFAAHGPVLRQGHLRPRGRAAQPPVPPGEGRDDLRPLRPDRDGDRGPGGPLDTEVVGPGHAFHLKPGTVHRWRALEDTVVLEASTPEIDDVVRLEDRYGRAEPASGLS